MSKLNKKFKKQSYKIRGVQTNYQAFSTEERHQVIIRKRFWDRSMYKDKKQDSKVLSREPRSK